MQGAVFEDTVVSDLNQSIFRQRGALMKENKISTDPVIETEHSSTFALDTANKLNTQRLNIQITAYKEIQLQKILQIHIARLPKQNEALATSEKKTDSQKAVIVQGQNDDSF